MLAAMHSGRRRSEHRLRFLLPVVFAFLTFNLVVFRTFGADLFEYTVSSRVAQVGAESAEEAVEESTNSTAPVEWVESGGPEPAQAEESAIHRLAAPADDEEHLAFCVFVRNQALDLPEWFLHHYHHHGVRRFYVQDDGSVPPLSTFEYPIPAEAMTFSLHSGHDVAGDRQIALYHDCIQRFGSKHKWMAFFDVDEFVEVRGNETLLDILKELERDESVGSLGINWRIHTSAGQLQRVPSVRQAYDQCIIDYDGRPADRGNLHVKAILRPLAYQAGATPHHFALKPGFYAVGEDGKRFGDQALRSSPWRDPITRKRLSLHHYVMKSRQEFQDKIDRWSSIAAKTAAKNWDWWKHIEEELPHVECAEMTMYRP